MKSFLDWAKEKGYDIEELKAKFEGSAKRAGVRSWAYPPQWSTSITPPLDKTPTAADAVTYLDDK